MSQIERKQASATVDLLDKLAKALGARIGEFFLEPDRSRKLKPLSVGRKPTRKRLVRR